MKECFYEQATTTSILYNFEAAFEFGCTRCTLSNDNKPIIYRGNTKSDILLLGECPGKIEEEEKKPFVGPAGQLLDKMFAAININTNEDMCISNTLYCRPAAPKGSGKQNYTPKPEQIEQCLPFMEKFVELINPKILIACGGTALKTLKRENSLRVSDYEGKWDEYNGINMFTMCHPAFLIYKEANGSKEEYINAKRKVWNYMQYFRDTYKEKLNE